MAPMNRSLLALCALLPLGTAAQLVVTNTQTPAQLVQNVLLGGGVTASNFTFNGLPANTINPQAGEFDGTSSNVGLAAGMIMGSGDVTFAIGPNNVGSGSAGGGNWGFNDPDLDQLSGVATHDAAILEFDFIPTGDSLKFNYVFGSEEYDEYVCGTVNDVFGFFLSGPGITGPFTNNAINIALVPGTQVPVSINTVNNGTVGTNGTASNCAALDPNWMNNNIYYSSNANGTTVQYDGMTVVLTARAEVVCGQTYHIKIAIADGGDTAFDSGVFLEAGSFVSTGQVVPDLVSGVLVNDSTMLEGCGLVDFTFYRMGDSSATDTVNLAILGTATPGVDYSPPFPNQLIFYPGDTAITFLLTIPQDADGLESIIIQIQQLIQCAGIQIQTEFHFYIDSPPPLAVQASNIQSDCNLTELLAPVVTGGSGNYQYSWSTGETTPTISVSPGVTTTYTFTVSDTCSIVPATVDITVDVPVYAPMVLTLTPDTAIPCLGDADLSVLNVAGGDGNFSYEWTTGTTVVGSTATVNVNAGPPTYYVATVTDGCGSIAQDSVLTSTAPLPPIEIVTNGDPTVICVGDTTTISIASVTGGNGVYTYIWEDANGTVIATGTSTDVPVPTDAVYTFTASDQCGYTGSAVVATYIPHPDPLLIDLTEDQVICYGDSLLLSAQITGGSGIYRIEWPLLAHTDPEVMVTPLSATTYVVNVYEECGLFNSAQVEIEVEPTLADIVVTNEGIDDWQFDAATYPEPLYYFWNLGDGTKASTQQVSHSYADMEDHWVHLEIVTANGCRATDSVYIIPPAQIHFPNAFTPDGDGINEVFGPVSHMVSTYEMTIFDRWGEQIFASSDEEPVWDGKVNGNMAPTGVYVYKYKAEGHYMPPQEGYGHVTLIRGTIQEN